MDRQAMLREIDRVIQTGPFSDTWDSLGDYRLAEWYPKAKFGIFIHWGAYAVPAYRNEWYPRNMYIQGTQEYEHHIKTYGPHKQFGYKDFIPLFRAERFDPEAWADLFVEAGAKYVTPVAEHHDGFQMYQSELSHWNAYEMGPRRDVIGELLGAFEKRGLIPCLSSHRAEHWFFLSHGKEFDSDIKEPLQCGDFYWPSMPEANHHDLFSQPTPSQEFLEDWLLRTCELADRYRPSMVYFDWWIQHSAMKPYLKKFAAYYYNQAARWGKQVAITYKHDAFQFGCGVVDVERGQFAKSQPYFWQTDTALAKNSWCYTEDNEYKTAGDILRDLCDIVSKNGTMMLNVGPKADGTIPEQDAAILREIGAWLKTNGEAIYESKPWRISGEGPTQVEEGQFTDGKDKGFTPEDIRFTVRGENIYAIVLRCPEDGQVKVRALGIQDASHKPNFHGIIKAVSLLGSDAPLEWDRTGESLAVRFLEMQTDCPVVLKIQVE